jgi:hypothetical protein
MAPEPISTAYLINPSHRSVCLYMQPPIVARYRLDKKRYRCKEYTRNNRTIRSVLFYEVRVVSNESGRLVLPRTSCFRISRPKW